MFSQRGAATSSLMNWQNFFFPKGELRGPLGCRGLAAPCFWNWKKQLLSRETARSLSAHKLSWVLPSVEGAVDSVPAPSVSLRS